MFALVLKTVKERKSGFVGAFVALLGASMLITAFGIILQSGIDSGVPAQRYSDAAVVVAGRQEFSVTEGKSTKTKALDDAVGVPRSLLAKVAAVPGVRQAVADLRFPTQLVGKDGGVLKGEDGEGALGTSWPGSVLGPFHLAGGRGAERPGEVVLEKSLAERAGVKAGGTVRLATTQAAASYTVAGVVEYRGPGDGLRTPPVFFSEAQARQLYGRDDQVSAIGVLAKDGTDPEELAERIEGKLGGTPADLYTGDALSSVENPDVASARGSLKELAGSLGGTVILITLMVVSSTLALGVHQRRRELALLRAVGATPKQIHKMIAGEALVISLLASVIGCLPGALAAGVLRGALSVIGVVPDDFAFSYGPVPMVAAVAIGVATAQIAGFAVARKVVAIRPVEALSQSRTEEPTLGRARGTFGVVLLVLGLAASMLPLFFGSIFAVAGAGSGGLIMVIAILMLAPPVVGRATRLLARPFRRRFGTLGYLAVANTRANARRLAAGIGPLILAIGFASVQLFIPTTTNEAAKDQAAAGVVADYTLGSDLGGVPVAATGDIARLPGVSAAAGVVRTKLFASRKLLDSPEVFDYEAQGVTPGKLDQLFDLEVDEGDLNGLGASPDTVALSSGAASTLGAGVGDRVRLHLPDGAQQESKVVAVYRRGLGFGDVTLPHDTVIKHSSKRLDDSVLVRLAPDADRDKVADGLSELAARYPGLKAADDEGVAREKTAMAGLVGSALPLVLVFGYIAVAVANTLVMTTLSRVREFALLRLVGATPDQVMRMMRTETLMVVLIAVVVGTVVPLLPLVTVSVGLTSSPVPYIPPLLYLGIVAATAALAAAAVLLPTRLALRSRPADAIGMRE
ncbi:FtsX-like permease family protein [Streptomyces albofaciens JCM 4342]|uniref:ABC transporter permease n=1 Tax=Streptomyces albofaciens TaxID=66866 RepID=UPI0012396360|nr:FtsX-like permease family protein [Streptomyces albofaciens]KAA6213464.1 FtsX-like permease family protein [Streptomyces albofaciens JCM 4342]